jgi:hypothetical protein
MKRHRESLDDVPQAPPLMDGAPQALADAAPLGGGGGGDGSGGGAAQGPRGAVLDRTGTARAPGAGEGERPAKQQRVEPEPADLPIVRGRFDRGDREDGD